MTLSQLVKKEQEIMALYPSQVTFDEMILKLESLWMDQKKIEAGLNDAGRFYLGVV